MERTLPVVSVLFGVMVALSGCVGPSGPPAKPLVTVKMGHLDPASVSHAPLLIAQEMGFFAEQGVTVESVGFANSADIAAPLSSNQIDVGQLGVNAGLFNAFNRGIRVVIAADGASSGPGFDYTAVVVRKPLIDGARFKTAADLKGLKVSIQSRGTPAEYGFDRLLRTAGLSLKDVDLQLMGFPNLLTALQTGGVDVGWEVEPFLTQSLDSGSVVVFKRGEELVPGAQLSILAFSAQFASNPDTASRFLAGWLKGARLYNDAFGKHDPRARDEVFGILKKRVPTLTDAFLERVAPFAVDPDGKVNVASLDAQQTFYLASGSQEHVLDLTQLADPQYSQQAVKILGGPYRY